MESIKAFQRWEERFGERVKHLRKARDWNQGELAERMTEAGYPMHQTTVAKMESAARPTNVGEVAALASIFGVAISQLFEPDDEVSAAYMQLVRARGKLRQLEDEMRQAQNEQHRLEGEHDHAWILLAEAEHRLIQSAGEDEARRMVVQLGDQYGERGNDGEH